MKTAKIEAGIAHFFKQRYESRRIVHDGLLDGEVRQAWPASPQQELV